MSKDSERVLEIKSSAQNVDVRILGCPHPMALTWQQPIAMYVKDVDSAGIQVKNINNLKIHKPPI